MSLLPTNPDEMFELFSMSFQHWWKLFKANITTLILLSLTYSALTFLNYHHYSNTRFSSIATYALTLVFFVLILIAIRTTFLVLSSLENSFFISARFVFKKSISIFFIAAIFLLPYLMIKELNISLDITKNLTVGLYLLISLIIYLYFLFFFVFPLTLVDEYSWFLAFLISPSLIYRNWIKVIVLYMMLGIFFALIDLSNDYIVNFYHNYLILPYFFSVFSLYLVFFLTMYLLTYNDIKLRQR